jgi:hypothetical protein
MHKFIALVMMTVTLLIFASCNKERVTQQPSFVATGFWRGNFPIDVHTIFGIVNRPDGTSRYFLMGDQLDTTQALLKYDGTYRVDGNFFHADYHFDSTGFRDTLIMETLTTSPTAMTGIIIERVTTTTEHGEATYNYNLIKQ